jgi:hypothetical protein
MLANFLAYHNTEATTAIMLYRTGPWSLFVYLLHTPSLSGKYETRVKVTDTDNHFNLLC